MIPAPYHKLKLQDETDRHWKFFCPFHIETEPSFTVNKTEPFYLYYRCWGCGANGSPSKFARLTNQKEFPIRENEVKQEIKRPQIDWEERLIPTTLPHLNYFSTKLGLNITTINKFKVGNDGKEKFLIPMYNKNGICGIQEHWWENGEHKKRCQRYSKHGIFRPLQQPRWNDELFIAEGFSDCAVLTELGLVAVGRFNALSVSNELINMCNQNETEFPVYIISDTDRVGIEGSKKLQKLISNSKIIYPIGHKDLRDKYLQGGKEKTKKWIKEQISS